MLYNKFSWVVRGLTLFFQISQSFLNELRGSFELLCELVSLFTHQTKLCLEVCDAAGQCRQDGRANKGTESQAERLRSNCTMCNKPGQTVNSQKVTAFICKPILYKTVILWWVNILSIYSIINIKVLISNMSLHPISKWSWNRFFHVWPLFRKCGSLPEPGDLDG